MQTGRPPHNHVAKSRSSQTRQAIALAANIAKLTREIESLLRIPPRRFPPPEREQMRPIQHPNTIDRRLISSRCVQSFINPGRAFVQLAAVEPLTPMVSRFTKGRHRQSNLTLGGRRNNTCPSTRFNAGNKERHDARLGGGSGLKLL